MRLLARLLRAHSLAVFAAVLAAVGTSCGRAEPDAFAARARPMIAADPSSDEGVALGGLPWVDRIALEQALANDDPRHAPQERNDVPVLDAAVAGAVTFERGVANVGLDGSRALVFGMVGLGRADAIRRVTGGAARIAGRRVETDHGHGIVEWWRSLPSGLEHGVTIVERPDGHGELVLEVEVAGDLHPTTSSEDSVDLRDASGAVVAHYAHLYVVDANDERIPASLGVAGSLVRIEIDDARARYPLIVDPLVWLEEATLLASGSLPGDRLGDSVALSADGSRAIVGASTTDVSATAISAGSALVFVRSGATWSQESVLLPSVRSRNQRFGLAVAMSADGTRVLVGAHGDSGTGINSAGSAWVFVRVGTAWTQEAMLLASDAGEDDQFGWSVALSADASLALVGAHHDDTTQGGGSGSVRVFVRAGSTWTEGATLLPTNAAAGDQFGTSVALTADGSRALVGAPLDDTAAGSNAGSVRTFVRSGSSWIPEATLLAAGAESGDLFGASVALSADGTRAVIGAWLDDYFLDDLEGSARVFLRTGSSWTEEALLRPGVRQRSSRFGTSVSMSADGQHALVGAPLVDPASAGSAWLFSRAGTTWTEEARLLAGDAGSGDRFGQSVALSADGDRALIGVPLDDTAAGADAGSARVFAVFDVGATCTTAATCPSGFCVDGVCCSSACGGGAADDCQACSMALTGRANGICAPVPATAAVSCRPAAGACDVAELCDGTSTACPPDAFVAASTVCAPALDVCDVAEACTGTSAVCPVDRFASAAVLCRASAGTCDVAERCTGASASCPSDVTAPAGTVCRDAIGLCDVAETCSGTDILCPTDARASAGTICRDASAPCDAAETCDGTSAGCPLDALASAGTVCRPAAGMCDVAETCTGTASSCPTDVLVADGTLCDDALTCREGGSCVAGVCGGGEALTCDDSDPCTADSCAEPGGCAYTTIPGCGDGGVLDGGPFDAGARDGGTTDGGTDTDAGTLAESGGCTCGAAGARTGSPFAALLVALSFVARRMRRLTKSRRCGAS